MKKTLFLMCLIALVNSCGVKQEPKIVYKYIEKPIYIDCQKPVIPEKPEFQKYEIFRVKFENKYYYCADIENARILSENWLRYKSWCKSLEEILNEKIK